MITRKQILALILCVTMIASAGCAGWGGDGPAPDTASENETSDEEQAHEQNQTNSSNSTTTNTSNNTTETNTTAPSDDDTSSQSSDECPSDCPDSEDSPDSGDSSTESGTDGDNETDTDPSDDNESDTDGDEGDDTEPSEPSDGDDNESEPTDPGDGEDNETDPSAPNESDGNESDGDEKLTCDAFDTQPEAQMYYDEAPDERGHLDADNDDIPCESLPEGDTDVNESDTATGVVKVVDQNGDPVEGEPVTIWPPGTVEEEATETQETNEDGEVVIELLAGDPTDVAMHTIEVRDQEQHLGIMSDEHTGTQEVIFEVDTSEDDEQEQAPTSAIDVESLKHGGAEPFTENDRVTIANTHDELPLDVGGWAVDVSDQQEAVTLPDGLVLEPGESHEIVLDGDDKVLDAAGGVLYIYDEDGNEVASYSYVGSPSAPYHPPEGNETNETAA